MLVVVTVLSPLKLLLRYFYVGSFLLVDLTVTQLPFGSPTPLNGDSILWCIAWTERKSINQLLTHQRLWIQFYQVVGSCGNYFWQKHKRMNHTTTFIFQCRLYSKGCERNAKLLTAIRRNCIDGWPFWNSWSDVMERVWRRKSIFSVFASSIIFCFIQPLWTPSSIKWSVNCHVLPFIRSCWVFAD